VVELAPRQLQRHPRDLLEVVLGQAGRDPGLARPRADVVVDDRRAEQDRRPRPALEQVSRALQARLAPTAS